jgi:hypothetical protein
MNPSIDQFIEPGFVEEISDVGLADAGGHTGQQAMLDGGIQPFQGPGVNILLAPPLITDHFPSFNTYQGGGITSSPHALGNLVGDQLAVGEDLKIGLGLLLDQIQQLWVHEGFPAEKAKKSVAVRSGFIDQAMQAIELDAFSRGFHIHPAALAAEVTAVQDAQVEKRRENNATLSSLFEAQHRQHAFEPKEP